MATSITPQQRQAQLNYDLGNAQNDVKEIASIKAKADAAPNHQISADLVQQLNTVQRNYATNLNSLTVDLAATSGEMNPQDYAHIAGLVDAMTKNVQDTTTSLETNNNLDGALQDIGSSAGDLHVRQDQLSTANSNLQKVAAPVVKKQSVDPTALQQEVQNLVAGINAESPEPYAAGHQSLPSDALYDVYDTANPQFSVQNPTADLATPATPGSIADRLGQFASQDARAAARSS